MLSSSALIGFASLNVVLSFAYQWYVVTTMGVGTETDALFAGMVVPQLLFVVVSGSLSHVLVPLFSTEKKALFQVSAWMFFQIVVGLFASISIILGLLTHYWVPLIVPGFDQDTILLIVSLTQIQLISVVFMAGVSVLTAAFHAKRRFIRVEFGGALANIAALFLLIFGLSRYGVEAAAWGLVVRSLIQMITLIGILGSYQKIDWKSKSLSVVWKRIRPLIAATIYVKSDRLVDRFLSSMAAPGSLTLIHLSQQLYGAGHTVVDKVICSPMVPALAGYAAKECWNDFQKLFRRRLWIMLAIVGSGYLFVVLFGQVFLELLLGYGAFEVESLETLWGIMVLSVGFAVLPPVGHIIACAFYSVGNTRVPAYIGVVAYSIGVLFKVGLFLEFGLEGLVVGISLHYLLGVGWLYLAANKDKKMSGRSDMPH